MHSSFSFFTVFFIIFFLVSVRLMNAEGTKTMENNKESTESSQEQIHLFAATLIPAPQDANEQKNIIDLKNRIRIINLGPIINHKGLDYAPTISADGRTLYYVSNRPGSRLTSSGNLSHDFWAAKKNDRLDTIFFLPFNIDTTTNLGLLGVNTQLNEGAASIAADKQSLYFTGCNRPDGFGDCDLYKTTIEGDHWGRPINLGKNVNSKYWDSQPSIAPDQSRLYFSSVRPGPHGDDNFDIWYCDWDDENEEWKPAKNLEEINTPGVEVSPFIAADNVTLFFASDGHTPLVGDQDFFVTRYDSETHKWAKPENLGEPINTPKKEQFITLPASGDILYFSSDRKDLSGYQGELDIFMAFVPSFFKTVLVKVTVIDECSQEFIPATIQLKNPVTGKIVHDTLSLNKKEFQVIITNQDYGNPKDSINRITLEITAENPKYGKKMTAQVVNKPKMTIASEDAGKISDEFFVTITLGQKPVIDATMEEANYIKRTKEKQPALASYRGLVMEQVQTWDLYPLLNYVFFPKGTAVMPDRYILFQTPDETKGFTDTTIAGGTLDKYYHLLNIYGYRLKKFPDTKIEIVGCNDGTSAEEKKPGLSKERADLVYNYFKNIWQIEEKRLKLTTRNQPQVISNLKDSLGIQENWRVEILSNDWEIMKPVFDKDPKIFPSPDSMHYILTNGIEDILVAKRRVEITRDSKPWKVLYGVGTIDKNKMWMWTDENGKYPKDEVPFTAQLIVTTTGGKECKSDPITIPVKQVKIEEKRVQRDQDSTLERYNLILFPFDRSDAGPINERIMRDYVYQRVYPTSSVNVIGHTDVVGLYEHNQALSDRRSNTVHTGIDKTTKGKYFRLNKRGVGEDEPLYDNILPEGRFYNRTVQVIIRTPVTEFEK